MGCPLCLLHCIYVTVAEAHLLDGGTVERPVIQGCVLKLILQTAAMQLLILKHSLLKLRGRPEKTLSVLLSFGDQVHLVLRTDGV